MTRSPRARRDPPIKKVGSPKILSSTAVLHRAEAWMELQRVAGKPRKLVKEPDEMPLSERCVICKTATKLWLQPENAPLCSKRCLDKYLTDPTVYDPLGLYSGPLTIPPILGTETDLPAQENRLYAHVMSMMSKDAPAQEGRLSTWSRNAVSWLRAHGSHSGDCNFRKDPLWEPGRFLGG